VQAGQPSAYVKYLGKAVGSERQLVDASGAISLERSYEPCGEVQSMMIGPPGAGKTLLARALPGILPRMTIDEALDVTRIYSVADQLPPMCP
jgi:predicted ATPase with chaperone activity